MAPEPRSADTPSGDADHTEASEPQVDYKEGAEQWFYVSAAGRQGPIDRDLLRSHAANGEIAPDSLVWKSGLPDWIKFSELDRLPTPTVPNDPFPVPAPRSNVYPWALSLAPLWGTAIQIMATDSRLAATHEKLANYSEMWWIVALLNILVAYLDLARFNKNDRHGEKIAKWWCLAVPFYIYRRDRIADAGMTRFWTWIGSLALALGILQFLNKIYAHQIIG